MKHFLPILSIAFCLLLTACGNDEPNVYDKVSGHTYATVYAMEFGRDTITFNSNGIIRKDETSAVIWEQEQNLVFTYYTSSENSDIKTLMQTFEVFDKKIILIRTGAVYRSID